MPSDHGPRQTSCSHASIRPWAAKSMTQRMGSSPWLPQCQRAGALSPGRRGAAERAFARRHAGDEIPAGERCTSEFGNAERAQTGRGEGDL